MLTRFAIGQVLESFGGEVVERSGDPASVTPIDGVARFARPKVAQHGGGTGRDLWSNAGVGDAQLDGGGIADAH